MAKFINKENLGNQEVEITLDHYKAAASAGMSLENYINKTYPTSSEALAKHGSTFKQMLAAEGITFSANRKLGESVPKLSDVYSGKSARYSASAGDNVVKGGFNQSRILFPAAVLSTLTTTLEDDDTNTENVFNKMVAMSDTIPGTKFERALIDTSQAPSAKPQRIAQFAEPVKNTIFGTTDKTYTIPTMSIGLQWSDQFAESQTIDLIALTLAKQARENNAEMYEQYLMEVLLGSEDIDQKALVQKAASVYDATLANKAGQLTQQAWLKYLLDGYKRRTIDMIVTDLDGYTALQKRADRPVVVNNTGDSLLNVDPTIANFPIASAINVWLVDNAQWPTGTYMGFDTRYGLQRVRSLSASYTATEQFLMSRSTAMRIDTGEVVLRLMDDAFSVMNTSNPNGTGN